MFTGSAGKYKQDKYSANKITGLACTDLFHVNLKKTAHVPAVKEKKKKKTLYRLVDLSQWMIPFIILVRGVSVGCFNFCCTLHRNS